MSNLLIQLLRNRSLTVNDGVDDDALYNLVMKQVRVSFVTYDIINRDWI